MHSTIVMVQGGHTGDASLSYSICVELIAQNERHAGRQQKLMAELEHFFGPLGSCTNGLPIGGLDAKSRDDF